MQNNKLRKARSRIHSTRQPPLSAPCSTVRSPAPLSAANSSLLSAPSPLQADRNRLARKREREKEEDERRQLKKQRREIDQLKELEGDIQKKEARSRLLNRHFGELRTDADWAGHGAVSFATIRSSDVDCALRVCSVRVSVHTGGGDPPQGPAAGCAAGARAARACAPRQAQVPAGSDPGAADG